jgi:hypothetical protein
VNHKRFLGTLPPEPVLLKTTIAGSSTRVFAEAGASFAIRGAFCAAMARVTVGSPLSWFRASAPLLYHLYWSSPVLSYFKAIAQSGSTKRQLPEELSGQLVSLARGMAREGIMTNFSSSLGSINHHPCYLHTVNKPLATTLGWIQGTHTQNVVDNGSRLVFTVPAPYSRAAERRSLLGNQLSLALNHVEVPALKLKAAVGAVCEPFGVSFTPFPIVEKHPLVGSLDPPELPTDRVLLLARTI